MGKEQEFVPVKVTEEEREKFRELGISERALDRAAKAMTSAVIELTEDLIRQRQEVWDGLHKTYGLDEGTKYNLNVEKGEITKALWQ